MKTTSQMTDHRTVSNFVSLLVVLSAVASFPSFAAADAPATELKPYTLFFGADLDVQVNKVDYRVNDVEGGSFVIKVNGADHLVPMDKGPIELRIEPSLKLTEVSATVDKLQSERTYTPGNDPQRRYVTQQAALAGYRPDTMNLSQSIVQGASRGAGIDSHDPIAAQHNPITSSEQLSYNPAPQSGQDLSSSDFYAGKMHEELAKGLFDAVEISFEVSAEKPLSNPYLVVVARYREPTAPPGASHYWIYAKALEPIDSKPRKVRFSQGGFPPGFELEKLQLHLYNRGTEIATNVADKRVALTRDEAFQYVVVDYISNHKGVSLPATPAMGKLPADLRTRLGADRLTQFFFIKVSKDGLPVEAYVDESCSHKVDDPYLQSVIREIRFKPALDKGRPVEGIALLKFSDLRL